MDNMLVDVKDDSIFVYVEDPEAVLKRVAVSISSAKSRTLRPERLSQVKRHGDQFEPIFNGGLKLFRTYNFQVLVDFA